MTNKQKGEFIAMFYNYFNIPTEEELIAYIEQVEKEAKIEAYAEMIETIGVRKCTPKEAKTILLSKLKEEK